MKVLDVQQFHEGLHRNIEKLNRLEEEIQGIKQAVEELVLLEDALKGEGGNAIRAFYQECHLPLLDFFISFKSHFADTLRRIGEALDSLEPDRMGYIRQEFLEGEVQAGLEEIRRITGTLTDETNSIMDSVADIVSLPHLDDSEVQEGVRSSERQRDATLEGLMEFDHSQTAALSPVAMDLKKMEQWIIDVESMMTGGLTGVDFPAESWKTVTARHPLRLTLTAHDGSVDGLSNMSGLNRPNMVSGANSYQVGGMATYGQPLYPMGIAGVNASTVQSPTAGERIRYNLVNPGTAVDIDEGNGVKELFKDAGESALNIGKSVVDFLFLEDLKTLIDSESSLGERGLAIAGFLPVGKGFKAVKLADKTLGTKNTGYITKGKEEKINRDIRTIPEEETIVYRRVQGGEGTRKSQERLSIDDEGNVYIRNKNKNLNISIDNGEHAAHFLENRNNAYIVEFEVPKWFDDFVTDNTIPQAGYKKNPLNQGGSAPKLTDPTTPGKSVEFPEPWVEWIEEYSKKGKINKGGS
ncbi:LXG domain of WXG superfamily protein [Bhargavaea ginsengi]|uniref:LXG domain of WXG superfamily protein n=1 Tax=Bhargavaea ginsengi TaxID=426757 RepID=A0A1H6YZZ9_9BACL|nr:LXG domain-containing protein [Bhargavaea ginsengi]SEJ42840.1 LXG domain of WXG superfamily protein [Bhargavaea ginsengi]